MGYFPVRYDSRVVIYECKVFIRLTTGLMVQSSYLIIGLDILALLALYFHYTGGN